MAERQFLIRIDALPEREDRRALLELILAAVSLEVPAQVLLQGDAVRLFASDSDRSWRQLIEQDLIKVLACDLPDDASLPSGIRHIDPLDRAKLVEQCTVIGA